MNTSACNQYLSDAQLVIQHQKSENSEAFAELYNRYHSKLYHYCITLTRDRDVSMDLAQDVFVRAAEKLHTLQHPATFPAWLFRIAHNEYIGYMKEAHKFNPIDIEACYGLAAEEPDESAVEKERLFEKMEVGLKKAGIETCALLRAKYMDKASVQDLTRHYGISESAMKMRLARARERVAHFL
ncbi:MAG: RNA polymerase sigma factor [Phaeodactylibacter sp.]|nr:RNA polymerase sigma factor [Phaeodactylibacter sp.]MCB9273445.1 RNA polymerase sigma factor [Lewinellaceae bacterium]